MFDDNQIDFNEILNKNVTIWTMNISKQKFYEEAWSKFDKNSCISIDYVIDKVDIDYSSFKSIDEIEEYLNDNESIQPFLIWRFIHEINASNFMTRQLGERLAMNSPIQGTAADIIKLAMIKVYRQLKEEGYKSRLILQVHDELIIETALDELDQIKKLLVENMESAMTLKVKLESDLNEGANWYDLK